MNKEYHYVVMYDVETNQFRIEWDTTLTKLEEDGGTIFDYKEQTWEAGFDNDDYNDTAERLRRLLAREFIL